MNTKEIRELPPKDLYGEVRALLRELFNLRMQKGSGQKVRTHMFKEIRRKVARIKTVMAEKTIEGANK